MKLGYAGWSKWYTMKLREATFFIIEAVERGMESPEATFLETMRSMMLMERTEPSVGSVRA